MFKRFVYLFFFFISTISFSQTLKGKVYDSEATVKGIKITNTTKNTKTVTDDKGEFQIAASVNDSIQFESLFHHPKIIVVTQKQLEELTVFELKKKVNELDEVLLSDDPKEKPLEEKAYNEKLNEILKEDMKQNPHLYQPPGTQYGVDFVYLIGQFIKLFKKKKKAPEFIPITYGQINTLFSTHHFFNERLLKDDLKIPEKHKYLFFEYCEARQIDSKLLKDDKRLVLLDHFVNYSNDFLELLKASDKDNPKKD